MRAARGAARRLTSSNPRPPPPSPNIIAEPPLNFRPTYKFDFDSDVYDSSSKQRIPAWADRILYVPRGLECLAYNSDVSLRTSDHRPVYATFVARVDCEQEQAPATPTQRPAPPLPAAPAFTSESQVCSVQ